MWTETWKRGGDGRVHSRRGPRRLVALTALAAGVALVAIMASCTPMRRYEVLSLLFDGVPHPYAPARSERRVSSQFIVEDTGPRRAPSWKMIRHEPYTKEDKCTACHPAEQAFFLGDQFDRRGLCFQCHEPFREELESYRYVHGPTAARFCLMCHDPHESIHPGLTLAKDPVLCTTCHDSWALSPLSHDESARKACLPCHDPHGGETPFFERTPPAAEEPAATEAGTGGPEGDA